MNPAPSPTDDKDAPLKADTRLLGCILGEVIRETRGEAAFQTIESIRQESVRFHREGASHRPLESILAVHPAEIKCQSLIDLVHLSGAHHWGPSPA